ncbi:phenylacetate--CoA ligase family protein [Streptomyces sp. NPDC088097]|uniref:phenylacetate--CoA ligase family protein n=1 Tax=Streptomyces sp. NPDC088097 TaxID=3365823 RepID=UPI0037F16724
MGVRTSAGGTSWSAAPPQGCLLSCPCGPRTVRSAAGDQGGHAVMRQRFEPREEHDDEQQWQGQMIYEALLFPRVHEERERYEEQAARGESVGELQGTRLREILDHAMRAVPAYRGVVPDVTGPAPDPWALLAKFPSVTKSGLARGLVDHCDDDIDPARCRVLETSGTSGIPLRVIRDDNAFVHEWATALVRNGRHGPAYNRKVLMPCLARLNHWFEYLSPGTGFTRVAQFGCDGSSVERRALYAERAEAFAPDVLSGSPRNLIDFMALLRENGRRLPTVRRIVTCGELLMPAVRNSLADFFGAAVLDMYAMKEVGTIAVQCEEGAYHIDSERLWVEIVDDSGTPLPEGRTGEIVVSDLTNRAMPLIRYRTGDFGSLATAACPCGLPHKAMDLVEGRNPGEIRRPDGSALPVLWAARAARRYPVRRYQIVQETDFSVSVLVAPAPSFGPADGAALTQAVEDLLGTGVDCRVRIVGDDGFHRGGRRKDVDFVSFLPQVSAAAPMAAGNQTPSN